MVSCLCARLVIPVQKQVSSYFEKELKKGDVIDLYLVRAGGIRTAGRWDWMLLVEEFLKPKDSVSYRRLYNNSFNRTHNHFASYPLS